MRHPVIHTIGASVDEQRRALRDEAWSPEPTTIGSTMGYTTDFIGHVAVDPPLNDAEQQYLRAFGISRRYDRIDGRYAIPGNPSAEADDERPVDIDEYNTVAPGQPSLWCQWTPCWDGCCISFDGHEKFYGATSWMRYLIDHFLAPGAHAASSRLSRFDGFTFNHMLNGLIAACRRDTRELYLIRVENNVVSEETLVPPMPEYFDMPGLPYEVENDRQSRRRPRPRSVG